MRNHPTTILPLLVTLVVVGCGQTQDPIGADGAPREHPSQGDRANPTVSVAVANSYLAAAVRDVLGPDEPLLLLAEPGMCPGHFDLRPSQVRQLRSCRLLVRFDFQKSLDLRLGDDLHKIPHVIAASVADGLCDPESYRSVCRQLADALVSQRRLSQEDADRRCNAISRRMDRLSRSALGDVKAAGLAGAPVLASTHQADFCRCLGLDVAATFFAADTAQPGQIDQAVRAGESAHVRLIVANRPEGRQLADALADRLGAQVVVLDNFPEFSGERGIQRARQPFDELVRRNVASLVQAAKP